MIPPEEQVRAFHEARDAGHQPHECFFAMFFEQLRSARDLVRLRLALLLPKAVLVVEAHQASCIGV